MANEQQLQLQDPDSARQLTVALASPCEETAAGAALEIYKLVGQGTSNGDEIREAGAIPQLVAMVSDAITQGPMTAGAAVDDLMVAEYALGTLAHLGMQRTANQEALCEAGGLSKLVDILSSVPPEDQCARYADSILTVMAMSSQSAQIKQNVVDATAELPDDIFEHYRELALFLGRGACDSYSTAVNNAGAGMLACVICTDEIVCDQPSRTLPCGHSFHYCCITDWLRYGSTCPTCRFSVRSPLRRRQPWHT